MKEAYMVESNTAIVSGGVIRIRQDNSERILMSKDLLAAINLWSCVVRFWKK